MMLVFFTTIVLTVNHLYSTFASPIVFKDAVAAGQSPNLTHTLVKRQYRPPGQLCQSAEHWWGRDCISSLLDQVWADICFTPEGVEYWRFGSCPEDTMCMNTYGPAPDYPPIIICLVRPTGPDDSPVGGNGDTPTGQVGLIPVPDSSIPITVERIVSVPIVKDIPHASVSALIEGTDGNYLVKPMADIVGSFRHTTAKVCTYNDTNRDCVPAGLYNLKAGDDIDFTFGLGGTQYVRFYYAILSV